MNNWQPIPFGSVCPKCSHKRQNGTKFCNNIRGCKTWKTFGGEHLHISCYTCSYVRVTVCKDADPPIPSLEKINVWLNDLAEEYNLESDLEDEAQFEGFLKELDPDWEPSGLDSDLKDSDLKD